MAGLGVAVADIARWWPEYGERPVLRNSCRAVACADERGDRGSFDVYCTGPESHLLVLGDQQRLQTIVVYGVRGLFGALVLAAATWKTTIPLQVVAALFGLLVVVLPLRSFPVARLVGGVSWAGLVALLAIGHDTSAGRSIGHALIGGGCAALFAGVVVGVALGGGRTSDIVSRSIGATLTASFASFALAIVVWAIGGPDGVTDALLVAALITATMAATGAAVAGFIRGTRRVAYRFSRPRPLTPRWMKTPQIRNPRGRGFAQGALFVLRRAAVRLAAHATRGVNYLLRSLCRVLDIARTEAKRLLSFFDLAARVLAAAAAQFVRTLADAVAMTAMIAMSWVRSFVLAIAFVTGAAVAANSASSHFAAYLDHGRVVDAAFSVTFSTVSVCALVSAWWPLTRQPIQAVLTGVQRLAENGGPPLFFTLVALGWADGILGFVGIGPLRPGWLTISGTAILVVTFAYVWRTSTDTEKAELSGAA